MASFSGTASTWHDWNDRYTTIGWDTASSTTATATTWVNWNDNYVQSTLGTTSVTADYTSTWISWNNDYTDLRIITAEDIVNEAGRIRATIPDAEMKRRNRKQHLTNLMTKLGEKTAKEKAHKLLKSILEPEQLEVFEADNVIPLFKDDGRKFIIEPGRQENIFLVNEEGKKLKRYCVTLRNIERGGKVIPDYDYMLAQMLLLESNEEEFMKIANVYNLNVA